LNNGKWFRGGCIAAALLMAVTLFFGAHEIGKVNLVPHFFHKVEHFFYYGAMAFLLAHGLGPRWFWIALLAVPLIGALDEWHQLYVPGRNSSVYDWMTDVVGTVVAVYVYYRWIRRSERKEEGKGP
jgi:VanZ family protein